MQIIFIRAKIFHYTWLLRVYPTVDPENLSQSAMFQVHLSAVLRLRQMRNIIPCFLYTVSMGK